MIGKIYRELLIILVVFVIGWLGFSYLKLKPKEFDVALSVEKELELGDVFAESILESSILIENDTVGMAIHALQERLLNSIELSDYDYNFYVIENENINAFATLGGHIFIYSGLLEFAESGEEVGASTL